MYVVAIAELHTPIEDEAKALAGDLSLTPYEVRLTLAAGLPAIVLTTAEQPRAVELLGKLRARNQGAIAIDDGRVFRRDSMIAMRRFRLEPEAIVAGEAPGDPRLPFSEILALLRGQVRSAIETTTEVKEKKLAMGRALMTGGLSVSKTETKKVTTREEDREQVLYVFRRGGATPWLLSESHAQYQDALKDRLAPTRKENFQRAVALLRERAPSALYDERLVKGNHAPGAKREEGGDTDLYAHLIATWASHLESRR